MKNLRMILAGFLCLGNAMALQAQEQSAPFRKLLSAINGSVKLSVKEFNGTALLSEQTFKKEVKSGETINVKVNPANVVTVL